MELGSSAVVARKIQSNNWSELNTETIKEYRESNKFIMLQTNEIYGKQTYESMIAMA